MLLLTRWLRSIDLIVKSQRAQAVLKSYRDIDYDLSAPFTSAKCQITLAADITLIGREFYLKVIVGNSCADF